jgi:mannosyltransferase OCH1-like enzyme
MYNYGGIWFDCDVMLLHSPQQVIKRFGEFVAQWEKQEYTNNCFLYFIQKGAVITALLKAAVRSRQSSGVSGLRELGALRYFQELQ